MSTWQEVTKVAELASEHSLADSRAINDLDALAAPLMWIIEAQSKRMSMAVLRHKNAIDHHVLYALSTCGLNTHRLIVSHKSLDM